MRLGDMPIGNILSSYSAPTPIERIIDNGPHAPVSILERIRVKTIRDLHERLSRLRLNICGYEHERTGKSATTCPLRSYNLACGHSHSYPEKSTGAAQILWDAMVIAKLLGILPSEMEQWFHSLGDGNSIISIPALSSLVREDYVAEARYRELNRQSISSFFLKRLLQDLSKRQRLKSLRRSLVLLQEKKGQELLYIRDQLLEVLTPLLDEDMAEQSSITETNS